MNRFILSFLLATMFVLEGYYTYLQSHLIPLNTTYNTLLLQVDAVKAENKELRAQIITDSSYTVIATKAAQMGLTKSGVTILHR